MEDTRLALVHGESDLDDGNTQRERVTVNTTSNTQQSRDDVFAARLDAFFADLRGLIINEINTRTALAQQPADNVPANPRQDLIDRVQETAAAAAAARRDLAIYDGTHNDPDGPDTAPKGPQNIMPGGAPGKSPFGETLGDLAAMFPTTGVTVTATGLSLNIRTLEVRAEA